MPAPLIPIAMGLAQVAPQIIRWLSGSDKAGEVAAQVVDVAQAITGIADPQQAAQAVQADPALQLQFQQRMAELSADMDKAYLLDRQDARGRDVALAQAGRRNTRADVMVAIDAFGLVVCLVLLGMYRKDLPGEVVALISTIASIFGLCLRDAHQFEFGSSRGSRDKDDLLAKAPPIER